MRGCCSTAYTHARRPNAESLCRVPDNLRSHLSGIGIQRPRREGRLCYSLQACGSAHGGHKFGGPHLATSGHAQGLGRHAFRASGLVGGVTLTYWGPFSGSARRGGARLLSTGRFRGYKRLT